VAGTIEPAVRKTSPVKMMPSRRRRQAKRVMDRIFPWVTIDGF
jgi:hypothetical protein